MQEENINKHEMIELEKALLGKDKGEESGEGVSNAITGSSAGARGGLLQNAMTSIRDNKDYRQELKTGYFTSISKQMQMVLALEELRVCGIDQQLVIDLLIAQKAGINGGLLSAIFQALTHTTFHTDYTGRKRHFWDRDPEQEKRL